VAFCASRSCPSPVVSSLRFLLLCLFPPSLSATRRRAHAQLSPLAKVKAAPAISRPNPNSTIKHQSPSNPSSGGTLLAFTARHRLSSPGAGTSPITGVPIRLLRLACRACLAASAATDELSQLSERAHRQHTRVSLKGPWALVASTSKPNCISTHPPYLLLLPLLLLLLHFAVCTQPNHCPQLRPHCTPAT
jgi:hypothetical protein